MTELDTKEREVRENLTELVPVEETWTESLRPRCNRYMVTR